MHESNFGTNRDRESRLFPRVLVALFVVLAFCIIQKAEAATLDYQSTHVFGTSALDYGSAMKTDSNGNLYVAGQFNVGTVDFDPTSGVDNQTNTLGGYDIFLTKINADGTYGWTRTWGGTGNDATYNLAFDSSNNVYVVGEFLATIDFDPGVGDTSYTSAGSVDIFLSKFDTSGNFLSVKVMGSTSHDRAHGVVINSTGEIFIAGKFNGTVDFDPSGGFDNKVSAGNYDGFLTKFNADETYGWTKTWGSTDRDTVNDLQLGTDGSIYLAGVYRLTVDFDPSGSVDNQTSVGLDDPFLTKLNADGSYAWTKTWGSTLNDFSFNLRVNSSNNVYIIGSFQDTVDFDPSGATNSIVSAGIEDSYVSKFDANGNYVFTRVWGGALMDEVLGITIDTGGNYFIGGFFNGTQDLDPTSGTDTYVSTGAYDMFVSMFDASDNYITSKIFGSGTETNWWDDQLYELNAYRGTLNVAGNYVGTADFDPTSGTDTKVAVGSGDFFRSTYTTGYTINFDAQGGSVSTSSKNVTYYAVVGSLPTPTLSGYSFSGWNTATDGSGTTYTDSSVYLLNADLTLYANFAINTYTLTYNASTHGTISGTTPQTVNYNTNGSAVTAVPDTNYYFVNWSDGSTSNPRTDTSVSQNLSATAIFAVISRGGGVMPWGWNNLPITPVGGYKIIANQGISTTTGRIITINSNAGSDVKKMAISLTGDFNDASQEDYLPNKQIDLCSKFGGLIKNPTCLDGQYKVYVKFYTQFGQSSNVILTEINLVTSPVKSISPNSVSIIFTKPFSLGMTSNDVRRLQTLLATKPEIYPEGLITGYFGQLTKKAVQKFQLKYGVVSSKFDSGFGLVGPKTRMKLQEVFGN